MPQYIFICSMSSSRSVRYTKSERTHLWYLYLGWALVASLFLHVRNERQNVIWLQIDVKWNTGFGTMSHMMLQGKSLKYMPPAWQQAVSWLTSLCHSISQLWTLFRASLKTEFLKKCTGVAIIIVDCLQTPMVECLQNSFSEVFSGKWLTLEGSYTLMANCGQRIIQGECKWNTIPRYHIWSIRVRPRF